MNSVIYFVFTSARQYIISLQCRRVRLHHLMVLPILKTWGQVRTCLASPLIYLMFSDNSIYLIKLADASRGTVPGIAEIDRTSYDSGRASERCATVKVQHDIVRTYVRTYMTVCRTLKGLDRSEYHSSSM